MAPIVFVRHGTTGGNEQGRLQGWSNASLTSGGRREAARAAALVKTVCEPRRIITSPLARAVETAEIVAEQTDAERVETDRGWKERSFGSLEGTRADTAFEHYPELHPKSAAFSAHASLDGESCRTVVNRVRGRWREIKESDEPLVIVTHETPIRVVTGLVDGTDPTEAIQQRSFTPGTTISVYGLSGSNKAKRGWIELPVNIRAGDDPKTQPISLYKLLKNRMSQATTQLKSVDDLDIIVDADGHTLEGIDEILPYVDNEAIIKQIERTDMPYADIFTYTHTGSIIGEAYGRGGQTLINDADEADQKQRDLDDFDIDYSVTTPTLHLMIHTVNNDRIAVALSKAYNDWVADTMLDHSDQFRACLVVPPQDPQRAAEEIERRGDDPKVSGVYMPPGSWTPLGNRYFDPIYEAAEKHDLTIVCHGLQMREGGFPVQANGAQTFAESHIVSLPWAVMWGMTSIMSEGVPERFPDLNFVFQEAGIGWIPWMRWRMDDHYLEYTDDFPDLEQLPSEYIDESFYFATQPVGDPRGKNSHIADIIRMAGPENIVYSADLPHMDFDPPEELFNQIVGELDPDEVRAIMGETAADLFDLPV